MERFHLLTDIYFGTDALSRLTELKSKKVFIVTDPFILKSDAIRNITRPLKKGGIPYEIFTDVIPDPPISLVIKGVKAFSEADCDTIIGLGGGSAMDLSKSIRRMVEETGLIKEHIRLICIPTTSGTGSEVTSFAVISDPDRQVKIPLVSESMSPDEAILDAVLVKSVPASVTADTGMDVLTHAIEAYVSTNHNDFSGALAEKAVAIIGKYLYRSFNDCNDEHARRKMHTAATLAGLAFNASSLGLNHGMAHQLGAHFHIPHGRANAMILPLVIEYNSGLSSVGVNSEYRLNDPLVERYCSIANVLGLSSVNKPMTIHSLCNYVRYMNEAMGIPSKLSDILDMSKEEYEKHLDAMAEAALEDSCTDTNPRRPSKPEVIELYRKLW
ncbi:MAG: 1-propanol dehydrogenase PduQ [Eubacteriales bacterium]|nr:1-propanol dehydrogenase PduQ [Eubacteriales bacterium]